MIDARADARARRGIGLAVGLSLLVHAVLLAIPLHRRGAGMAEAIVQGPLVVRIERPEVPEIAVPRSAEPSPPAPPPAPKKPPPRVQPEPRPAVRELTVPRPESPAPAPALPPPRADTPPAPTFDMAALIAANRERRRRAEAEAVRRFAREASPEQVAQANLARNLETLARNDGTGGIFRVTRVGARTGEFAFNGWNPTRRGQWRELIEVEAGPDGDVERAIVRRMIALIREHYSGDFQWESHRLDRVVILSAAPQDNEGLEEFLMREFFDTPRVRRGG